MLKEQNKIIQSTNKLIDLGLTIFAFILSYYIKKYYLPFGFKGLALAPNYYTVLLLIIIIWFAVFQTSGIYSSLRRMSLRMISWKVLSSVCISFILLTFCLYILHIHAVSRAMLLIFVSLDLIFLSSNKALVYYVLKKARKSGYNFRNILVVGRKERSIDVLKAIQKRTDSGYKVVGCLDIDKTYVGSEVVPGVKVLDSVDNLEEVLKNTVVDELLFAMPLKLINNADKYIILAEDMGVNVRFMPDWQIHGLLYKPEIATAKFENFLDVPTMALNMTPIDSGAILIKNIFDYSATLIGILLISPLFLLIATMIKIFSRGPVFYSQKRFGKNGRIFNVYKFRTMIVGADQMLDDLKEMNEADGPAFKIEKDPRIIPFIGTFLRKTSLDELPQLFNVLKGEMSLVGPRPPIIEEVDEYALWQRRRLSMKPGLTCVWQISPNRNDISFENWMRMDLQYIDKWSLLLDAKILVKTAGAVVFGSGR